MRYDKEMLLNGEKQPCTYCGRSIEMSIARKVMRRRLQAKGKEIHHFCTPHCRYEYTKVRNIEGLHDTKARAV
jgi:hypothetical protein